MKVCFVTKGTLSDFWENRLTSAKTAKVVVFGSGGLGLVSYESELEGETEYFHDVAKLSKYLNGVVISGCDTDTYGAFRRSAVVADSGKLLGVSDTVYVSGDSEYTGGANFTVYNTSAGRLGVLVGTDLYSFDAVKCMSLADADVIFCVFGKIEGFIPEIVLRSLSYLCGVPMALIADGYASVSSVKGEISFAGSAKQLVTDINTEKIYGEVFYKNRGCTRLQP